MEFFYGQAIDADAEQKKINDLLSKYRHEPTSEDLKKRIYNELIRARAEGEITIPFKVVMRKDQSGFHADYIEVILDTKV